MHLVRIGVFEKSKFFMRYWTKLLGVITTKWIDAWKRHGKFGFVLKIDVPTSFDKKGPVLNHFFLFLTSLKIRNLNDSKPIKAIRFLLISTIFKLIICRHGISRNEFYFALEIYLTTHRIGICWHKLPSHDEIVCVIW